MGNISVGIKKFLSNKNTVTILGVVAAVLVLYVGYNSKVNRAITPITVPYAKETINPGAQITEELIGTKNVSSATIEDGFAFTTYGNSIFPGNYIDIYLKAQNAQAEGESIVTSDKIMVGKLLENVKVLAVLDSDGKNVFANLDEKGVPSMMIFAVPSEYYILLNKAKYLRSVNTTLIPVPTDESLKDEPGELQLSSNDLKDYINNITVWTE